MTFIPIRPNCPPLEGNVPPEFAKAVRQAVADTCGHFWTEECNSHLAINICLEFPGHDGSCRHGDKAIPWQDVSKRLQALGFVPDKKMAFLRWVSPAPILTQVKKIRGGRKWFDWFRKVFKC